jgi:hypothetical protein
VGRLRSGLAPAGRERYASLSAVSIEHGGCQEEQPGLPRAVPILERLPHRLIRSKPKCDSYCNNSCFVNSKTTAKTVTVTFLFPAVARSGQRTRTPKKKPCMYCFPLLCGTANHEMRLNSNGVLPNGTFHFVRRALCNSPGLESKSSRSL